MSGGIRGREPFGLSLQLDLEQQLEILDRVLRDPRVGAFPSAALRIATEMWASFLRGSERERARHKQKPMH